MTPHNEALIVSIPFQIDDMEGGLEGRPSDFEGEQIAKMKQSLLVDSDSEPDDEIQKASQLLHEPPTADALFGDASDISSDADSEEQIKRGGRSPAVEGDHCRSKSLSRSRDPSEEKTETDVVEDVRKTVRLRTFSLNV
ncbi:hypothetical protein QAD02_013480 [Eretmocerus hayati]|uniref:Uncharacterized protein n=1 Tax=Eretmocerus hayati TaxID=131215 RepID=A0ACC2P2J4_9HYME|nr:hypothetical protein QAD02_013480 [Eretmocerus hayati]